jgi:hypothetical protein
LVAVGAADKGLLKGLCTKPLESQLALCEDLELIEKRTSTQAMHVRGANKGELHSSHDNLRKEEENSRLKRPIGLCIAGFEGVGMLLHR